MTVRHEAKNVKVIIDGGFGNQLFQLTSIIYISKTSKTKIFYVKDFLSYRDLVLNKFVESILRENGIASTHLACGKFIYYLVRLLNKTKFNLFFNLIFDFKYLDKTRNFDNLLLYSYCQNVSFDFIRNNNPFKLSKDKEDVECEKTCFIHIRGGDYLTRKNIKVFEEQDFEYYKLAIIKMKSEFNLKSFVIFTNDLKHAKKLLKNVDDELGVSFCFSSNSKMEDDFRDMSLMDFGIISNSTFAFWSVMSNYNESKKIIAPSKWYVKKDYPKFINKSWILMS